MCVSLISFLSDFAMFLPFPMSRWPCLTFSNLQVAKRKSCVRSVRLSASTKEEHPLFFSSILRSRTKPELDLELRFQVWTPLTPLRGRLNIFCHTVHEERMWLERHLKVISKRNISQLKLKGPSLMTQEEGKPLAELGCNILHQEICRGHQNSKYQWRGAKCAKDHDELHIHILHCEGVQQQDHQEHQLDDYVELRSHRRTPRLEVSDQDDARHQQDTHHKEATFLWKIQDRRNFKLLKTLNKTICNSTCEYVNQHAFVIQRAWCRHHGRKDEYQVSEQEDDGKVLAAGLEAHDQERASSHKASICIIDTTGEHHQQDIGAQSEETHRQKTHCKANHAHVQVSSWEVAKDLMTRL